MEQVMGGEEEWGEEGVVEVVGEVEEGEVVVGLRMELLKVNVKK